MEIAVGDANGILAVPVIVNRRKLKCAFDQIVDRIHLQDRQASNGCGIQVIESAIPRHVPVFVFAQRKSYYIITNY